MKYLVFAAAAFLVLGQLALAYAEDDDIAGVFREKNLNGTLVISSLDGKQVYSHNDERSRTRFVPDATFKIPGTLIALEESAIADEKVIMVWDGWDKGQPGCNHDLSLEVDFSSSCAWVDQEMAKRVGKEKIASYLDKMQYGNGRIGPEITNFWLEGDLRISAVGQVDLLKNIYTRTYPFKASSYDLLRKLMLVEETPGYTLRAKTGWAQGVSPQVGWYVGYVETGGQTWFFAANMEIVKPEDGNLRQEITMKALRLKGII
jgi:beta-lactamase class D